MSKKRALITGLTGQDGSYLAEMLLQKDFEVHGMVRRSSSFNTGRIEHLCQGHKDFYWHFGDLTDSTSLRRIIELVKPDQVYNLGAQSHVRVSFDIPEYTADSVAMGTLRLLEAVRDVDKGIKVYQASSSEMFGGIDCPDTGYDEDSPFYPRSPYAVAKVFAHNLARNYREAYDMHISCGILFNHESPRRGETFVTRKITRGVAAIVAGHQKELRLGNLHADRDWGYAPDYVEAMWRMVQADEPGDYVVATGEAHDVFDFAEKAFRKVGLACTDYVKVDHRYFRPTEVDFLLGNPEKIKTKLGWKPRTSFDELIHRMITTDLRGVGLNPKNYLKP